MNAIECYEQTGIALADYSGKRGEASYAGKSLEWRKQPIVRDPFDNEQDAIAAAVANKL
jgi:hypothetical protein